MDEMEIFAWPLKSESGMGSVKIGNFLKVMVGLKLKRQNLKLKRSNLSVPNGNGRI